MASCANYLPLFMMSHMHGINSLIKGHSHELSMRELPVWKLRKSARLFQVHHVENLKWCRQVVEETVIVEKEKIRDVKKCIRQRKMVSREREKYRWRVSLDLNVYNYICCRWNIVGGRLSWFVHNAIQLGMLSVIEFELESI